jgi:uncharacterized protein (TIGR02284 family)
MATEAEEVRDVLNDLIETCKDGEQGFRTAAEKVKESSLKSLWLKYAFEREQYGKELQSLVTQLGGDPETSGHIAGTLHRGWINLKEALSRDEDKALVDECEAGEDVAVKHYKEALGKSLPAEVRTILLRQFSGVQAAHRVMSDLKHGRAAMASSKL